MENILRQDEERCYLLLNNEVYPYLEWIENFDFKDKYRLNNQGKNKYPNLVDEIFFGNQIDKFVFELGINPLQYLNNKVV